MMNTTNTMVAINPDGLTDAQRLQFVETFTRMLYSGQGSTSNFSRQLGITEADSLRVMLGVPPAWLTDQKRRLFEAMYSYLRGEPVTPRPEIWIDGVGWSPKNPRHNADKALDDSQLDFEFLDLFGLRRTIWEKEVFRATLGAVVQKVSRGGDISDTNLRLFMALALFGFSEPEQFFI